MVNSARRVDRLWARSDWLWFGAIVTVALLLRLIYLLQLRDSPYFAYEIMDSAYHDARARKIAAGEPFQSGVFFRAPLYPWLLGLLYKLSGSDFFVIRLVQGIIGSLSCGLLYLAGRIACGRGVAIAAGFACATYWTLIYFDAELLLPNLLVFLDLLLLLALLALARQPKTAFLLLSGLALGLSAIARPNILLFAPLVAVWLLLLLPRWKAALRGIVIFGLALLLPIVPITIRNLVAAKDFVLISSQGGVNFYIGNNAQADGMHVYIPGLGVNTEDIYSGSAQLAEEEAGRPLKASEVSAHYMAKALDYMSANPGAAAKLLLAKLGYFWTHREVLNNKHLYVLTERYTPVIKFLPLGFWIVGPLGLMGLAACSGRWRELFPLWGFVACYMLSVVLFFVTARFRLPVVPVLILLGAYGVQRLVKEVRLRRWPLVAALVATLAVGGVLAARRPPGTTFSEALALERLGAALFLQQRPEEAITILEEAVATDPACLSAQFSLATGYKQLRMLPQAIAAYEKVLEIEPDHLPTLGALGPLLLQQGASGQAERHLRRAAALAPDDHGLLIHLTFIYAAATDGSLRDCAAAKRMGTRAVRMTDRRDPRSIDALAAAYAECGEFETALAAGGEALRLARMSSESNLARAIAARLSLYQRGEPFRLRR